MINNKDILSSPTPLIQKEVQEKIAEMVQSSFNDREKSKKLLDIAKKAVELAIENDEDFANDFIKKELEVL